MVNQGAARATLIANSLASFTAAVASLLALPSTPDGHAGSDIFARLQHQGLRSCEDLLQALHLVWGTHLEGAGIPLGEITRGVDVVLNLFLSVQTRSGGLEKASATESAEVVKWLGALTNAIEDRARVER